MLHCVRLTLEADTLTPYCTEFIHSRTRSAATVKPFEVAAEYKDFVRLQRTDILRCIFYVLVYD